MIEHEHLWSIPTRAGYTQCVWCRENRDARQMKADGFRLCEYCGCYTNARLRVCCDAGKAADDASQGAAAASQGETPAEARES